MFQASNQGAIEMLGPSVMFLGLKSPLLVRLFVPCMKFPSNFHILQRDRCTTNQVMNAIVRGIGIITYHKPFEVISQDTMWGPCY